MVSINHTQSALPDGEGSMYLNLQCVKCDAPVSFSVYIRDIVAWKGGMLIQDALPYLNADEREMLKTRICPVCWDKMFA